MTTPPQPPGLQTTLYTERLRLRMVDPEKPSDLEEVVQLYAAHHKSRDGPVHGISGRTTTTADDILLKHEFNGPKAKWCTLAPPPKGMFHLVYLRNPPDSEDGTPIGHVALSFRPNMPCPDIGYAILVEYEGRGYVTEAAGEVLRFWREDVGVREVFCGMAGDNPRSQGVARRLGFVEGGESEIVFGRPPDEKREKMLTFVLPGMVWPEGQVLWHTLVRG